MRMGRTARTRLPGGSGRRTTTPSAHDHKGTPVFHETPWWGCCPNSKKMDFDDFLAVPGCASGPHWTGEGDPPQVEEIISMSEEGFDLG